MQGSAKAENSRLWDIQNLAEPVDLCNTLTSPRTSGKDDLAGNLGEARKVRTKFTRSLFPNDAFPKP
jgi:hypothetical protein